MKLLIAGGGTGGHIFPALAVADYFSNKYTKNNVLFVGTKRGLEKALIPKHNYNISFIKIRGIKRTGLFNTLMALFEIPIAIISSIKIILTFKPNLVIGVGGYASGPALLAATLLFRKTAILEQNSVPGMTNRILSKFIGKIFISYEHNTKYFPKKKIIFSGNPVSEFFLKSVSKAYKKNPDKLIISILGGSQGSRIINNTFLDALKLLKSDHDALHIIHQTGSLDFEKIKKAYKDIPFSNTVKPFFDNMPEIYSKSDIVICRAGAMTITELQITGVPSILIPFAAAADNHQEINAKELVDHKAALLIKEDELSAEKLSKEIYDLIHAPEKRKDMYQNAITLAKPDAAKVIIETLLSNEKN